jgi:starch synthase
VAGALPKALRARGLDVRVVMPLYAGMPWNDFEILDGLLTVPMWWGPARARVRTGRLPDSEVPLYCLEFNRYFDRPYLYGPPGEGYPDNLERFTFLSRGALEICKALGFVPDVIHCNDWQTALIPIYVNTVEWMQPLHASASVYSIHNLAYQGVFDGNAIFVTGLGREHYHPGELEHFGAMNLTKGALYHSTLLSTVSPTYAREIQTPAYGNGLDGVLSGRSADLIGILNGIDMDEWNPAQDRHLPATFSAGDLTGKAACKAALQREAGFAVRPDVPLFGVIGRLTSQKGFDVLAHALDRVLSWDLQIVLLGTGDADAERFFAWADAQRGDRFRAWLRFDNGRAHRIEAGADFFLMPSRFEPCGLNQMYSQAYGSPPVVSPTGGLRDSVVDADDDEEHGSGFVMRSGDRAGFAHALVRAFNAYRDPGRWHRIQRNGMARRFGWEDSAAKYAAVYESALRRARSQIPDR